MTVLIIGVPDSGKSKKAEEIAVRLSEGRPKVYIATMIPFGEEGKRRVEKHRKLREGKNFKTIECPVKVHELFKDDDVPDTTGLLECMSNLIGNEMHAEENSDLTDDKLVSYIVDSVAELEKRLSELVIVTNSFPLDGEGYDDDTRRYARITDMVNNELRKRADNVFEFIDGEWSETD